MSVLNNSLSPVTVTSYDAAGNQIGTSVNLVSGGRSSVVTTRTESGKLSGLLDLRDQQIPDMLAQLDAFASALRDRVNAIHNTGTGYPGSNNYTGIRSVFADGFSNWTGSIRVAVLGNNGQPVASPYDDEPGGALPLTLDLSTLDTGNGAGNPSVQGIIDEINNHFGIPQNKAVVGNLNNIRLASDSTQLPGTPANFSFDFDLENISALSANFFVTGIQVLNDASTDITSVTTNAPSLALDATNGYVTTLGNGTVTINTTSAHGLSNGDRVYMSSATVDGISISGFYEISNITADSFQISTGGSASAGGSFSGTGETAMAAYASVGAGESTRTSGEGILNVDLTGDATSEYYTIVVDVAVEDEDGNLTTSQLTYRINNNDTDLFNDRYSVTSVGGSGGEMVVPTTTQPLAVAMLVDANGNELPKVNGKYTTSESGFLKIKTYDGNSIVAIDSLNSVENGRPNNDPPTEGTGRGFSHYFGLNNFFSEPDGSTVSDASVNSALTMAVDSRLISNPNLIALGGLVRKSSADPDSPLYTYERNGGDGSVVQQLSNLVNSVFNFDAVGGLGSSRQTLGAYAAQIVSVASSDAALATNNKKNAQVLLDGYNQRSDSISGVNLDEELANTIIYQNAYSASARVITVTSELFKTLIDAFA